MSITAHNHAYISDPHPDYLGPTWRARTIFLRSDDGGAPKDRPDVAVLVHEVDAEYLISQSGIAALWLPGFMDSFFHVELAATYREHGIPLVGLDFRRSGRSIRNPRFPDDIRDFFIREEEVADAVHYLRERGARSVVLIGHSTGGLQAALYAHNHPGSVDGVILNSPWLDHNGPAIEKNQLTELVKKIGTKVPRLRISSLNVAYARNLHQDFGGEFRFDRTHKPTDDAPVFAGFFRAARIAHELVANGLTIQEPVLVAHSDASGDVNNPTEQELHSTDVVLNVADMRKLGPTLGRKVTMLEIPGGRHDLALSRKPAREQFARETLRWIRSLFADETLY